MGSTGRLGLAELEGEAERLASSRPAVVLTGRRSLGSEPSASWACWGQDLGEVRGTGDGVGSVTAPHRHTSRRARRVPRRRSGPWSLSPRVCFDRIDAAMELAAPRVARAAPATRSKPGAQTRDSKPPTSLRSMVPGRRLDSGLIPVGHATGGGCDRLQRPAGPLHSAETHRRRGRGSASVKSGKSLPLARRPAMRRCGPQRQVGACEGCGRSGLVSAESRVQTVGPSRAPQGAVGSLRHNASA